MFSLFPAAAQGPQRKGSYPPGLFRTPFHERHASVYIFFCLLHFRPRLGTLMPSYPAIWNASKWFLYAQRAIESRTHGTARRDLYITGYYFILPFSGLMSRRLILARRPKKGVHNVGPGRWWSRTHLQQEDTENIRARADLSIFLPRPCRVVPCTMYDSIIDLAESASRVPAVH